MEAMLASETLGDPRSFTVFVAFLGSWSRMAWSLSQIRRQTPLPVSYRAVEKRRVGTERPYRLLTIGFLDLGVGNW
jgi:hypothetical protein